MLAFLGSEFLCSEIQVLDALWPSLLNLACPSLFTCPQQKDVKTGKRRGLPSSETSPTPASFEIRGSVSGAPGLSITTRGKWKFHSWKFHPSSSTQIVNRATPKPQDRAGHAPENPSPASRRRGPLPLHPACASFPRTGPGSRRPGPGREAAAARWLRRNAGSCRLGQHLQFSYPRHKSSTGIGHVPSPAPIPALEFFSPLQPESAASEENEPICWWNHWG